MIVFCWQSLMCIMNFDQPLKNRTYLGKKIKFFGANFLASKSGHWQEKQPKTVMNAIYNGIHHWWILWSSCRKFSWVEFEPKTTEFHPDTLTNWAIRPLVWHLANFVQLLQFHCFFSVTFHFSCLPWSVAMFTLIEVFCR